MKEYQLFSACATNCNGNIPKVYSQEKPTVFKISHSLEFLEFNFTKEEADEIKLEDSFNLNCYYFIYNLKDNIAVLGADIKARKVAAFESLIYFNSKQKPLSIIIETKKNYKFCIIKCAEGYLDEKTNTFFMEAHKYGYEAKSNWLKEEGSINFCGAPNLNIFEQLGRLLNCKKQFPFNFIAEGYVNIILGLALRQFMENKLGASIGSSLSRKEIKVIQELTDAIRKNPELSYSILGLARQGGLAVPKLQQGFKEMHGFTVSHFIREVRLAKAEDLIMNSDLNISEIVYTVGLTSRSYFSRIFKMKYNCSPSNYQQQQLPQAATA